MRLFLELLVIFRSKQCYRVDVVYLAVLMFVTLLSTSNNLKKILILSTIPFQVYYLSSIIIK